MAWHPRIVVARAGGGMAGKERRGDARRRRRRPRRRCCCCCRLVDKIVLSLGRRESGANAAVTINADDACSQSCILLRPTSPRRKHPTESSITSIRPSIHPSIHLSIHLYAPLSFAPSLLPYCISSHPCSAITNAARTKPYALAPTVTVRSISPCPTSQPPLNGSPAPPQPPTDTDTNTNRLAAHPIALPQPVLATHPPAPTEHGRDERVHAPYPGRGRWCCRPQHGRTA